MPILSYNNFETGISQDDFVVGNGNILQGKSIDGIKTGYGAVIGPNVNKQVTTDTYPMVSFSVYDSGGVDYLVFCGNDGTDGYIYTDQSADDTPKETMTTTDTTYNKLEGVVELNNRLFFIGKDTGNSYNIHDITSFDFHTNNFAGFNYDGLTTSRNSAAVPPILVSEGTVYVGLGVRIVEITGAPPYTEYSLVSGSIVGITKHGTTFVLYTNRGEVAYWDGGSSTVSASNQLGFIPESVVQDAKVDYITSSNGDMYIGSGYDTQRVYKKVESKRLNDNSAFKNKFKFDTGYPVNTVVYSGDVYITSSDETPGIYKYGELARGLNKGIHQIVSTDNATNDIDEMYALGSFRQFDKKIYFSYKQGTTYGVDYIDLSSNNTEDDGYIVTPVFSGGTTLKKQIKEIRVATSNTNGSNNVKVYVRIDNGSWSLVETINNTTATIDRTIMYSDVSEFTDIQFKVELHNDSGGEDSPILHELQLNYDIIKK